MPSSLDIVVNWLIVQPHKLKRAEKKVEWPDKSAAKFWPALKKKNEKGPDFKNLFPSSLAI